LILKTSALQTSIQATNSAYSGLFGGAASMVREDSAVCFADEQISYKDWICFFNFMHCTGRPAEDVQDEQRLKTFNLSCLLASF
jgi:hypothetical protein